MKRLFALCFLLLLAGCQQNEVREQAANTAATQIPPVSEDMAHEPPKIFVRQRPAHLLEMDGDQLYWGRIMRRKEWVQPLHDKLEFALNTPDDLFLHKPDKTLFLRIEKAWWSMPANQKNGNQWPDGKLRWKPVEKLPQGFELLPVNDEEWKPAYEASRDPVANPELEIITAFEPAVLVQLSGAPSMKPIAGTAMQWVANASRPLIYLDGQYYLQLSGRWFASPVLTDDARWRYVTPQLPAEFAKLPKTEPFASLRASVPGTEEAREALAAWHHLHERTVSLSEELPPVEWVEKPQFEPLKGTELLRAVTTHAEVVQTPDHRYWRCENRAWYVSTDPRGKWQPATALPKALQAIPVESPLFHCRFLAIGKVRGDEVTYVHTPGYGYHYPSDGVIVDGSGYAYKTDYLFQPFWQDYIVPMPHPQTYGTGKDKPLPIWYLIQEHNYIHAQNSKPSWHDLLHGKMP